MKHTSHPRIQAAFITLAGTAAISCRRKAGTGRWLEAEADYGVGLSDNLSVVTPYARLALAAPGVSKTQLQLPHGVERLAHSHAA